MNKTTVANFIKSTKTAMIKHSPEILTGIGIAGMITTVVLAVKATPKALALIEEEKLRRYKEDEDATITKKDVVKTCWKCYVPTALTGAASVTCLIGATSVSARRTAALATAYKLSETALTEYRDKVIETIGEKKEQTVREKVDEERIKKNPVSNNGVIITEKGNTLCYDYQSGRYFKSDIEKIKKAINEINRRMLIHDYISLNEIYDELGLDHTHIGDVLGWRIDRGYIEPSFSSHIADDGTPCIVLNYTIAPQHDYSRFA